MWYKLSGREGSSYEKDTAVRRGSVRPQGKCLDKGANADMKKVVLGLRMPTNVHQA